MIDVIAITLAGVEIQHRRPGPWAANPIRGGMAWISNGQGVNFLHIPSEPFAKLMTAADAGIVAEALNAADAA